jgi:hypothetical protein
VEETVTGEEVDRFFTTFAKRHTDSAEADPGGEPRLRDGGTPRGLVGNGIVRTTGWLQFGHRLVSSAFVAALAGLPVAAVIIAALVTTVPPVGGLIALLPALCYGGWRLLTFRLVPASVARNLGAVAVEDVEAGGWLRLHGSIGPVAQVDSTRAGSTVVEVTFVGGICQSWPRGHRLQAAEVLD